MEILEDCWNGWLYLERFGVGSKVIGEVFVAVVVELVIVVVVAVVVVVVVVDVVAVVVVDAVDWGYESYGTANSIHEEVRECVGRSDLMGHISSFRTRHEEHV